MTVGMVSRGEGQHAATFNVRLSTRGFSLPQGFSSCLSLRASFPRLEMTGAAHILAHMQDFTLQVNQSIGVGSVCEGWPLFPPRPWKLIVSTFKFMMCALAPIENCQANSPGAADV